MQYYLHAHVAGENNSISCHVPQSNATSDEVISPWIYTDIVDLIPLRRCSTAFYFTEVFPFMGLGPWDE